MMSGKYNRLAPASSPMTTPSQLEKSIRERRKNGHYSGNGYKFFLKLTPQETKAELERAAQDSWDVLFETLRALAHASDSQDTHSQGHSERVTRFSIEIGRIFGISEDTIEKIRVGALIHDIGKIAIGRHILSKPTLLTHAEYEVMKTHTILGFELLEDIPHLRAAVLAAKCHHERLDGNGYPFGLKGDEIPQLVRVISIADSFDAMTTTRIYQDPAPVECVLEKIRSVAGIKYDPGLVEALVEGVRAGRIIARSEDSSQNKT